MSTFLYAPGIRIFIKTENSGTLDVSDDLIDYTVQRRSDGPSTLNFSIQNIKRKYDGLFSPNDEVIVEMKRVAWVRVFTGLLNSVPLVTMWPRVVAFSASCSLKRLQYWYWDPQLASAWTDATVAMANGKGTSDAGITNVILTLLRDVVGWPANKAHIGAIPPNWFKLVIPYAQLLADQLVSADAQVASFFNTYGLGNVGGTPVDGSTSTGGTPVTTQASGVFKDQANVVGAHGVSFSSDQLTNAEIIIRVGKRRGVDDKYIAGALAVAMGESHLIATIPNRNGDGGLGLFQQGPGWGTVARRTDPVLTSEHFFAAFQSTPAGVYAGHSPVWAALYVNDGWSNSTRLAQRQAKQLPAHELYYDYALNLVAIFNASLTGATGTDSVTKSTAKGVIDSQTSSTGAIPTAFDFVLRAQQLVRKYPNIPYGSPSLSQVKQTSHAPTSLGCSSFISWVLYNYFGTLPWTNEASDYDWAESQYQWCVKHGGKELPLSEAAKTQGALLIRHPNSSAGGHFQSAGHIEISVGDGAHSIGATNSQHPASEHGIYLPQFDTAVLMPMFDYTQAKNGAPPQVYGVGATTNSSGVPTGPATEPYSSTAGFNPSNPIDALFGNTIAINGDVQQKFENDMALAFAGPRALLNDQPLLPYIKNLVNASMRSFCSAPNGDFMAWFPDYYGLWGTAAIMTIEPVELQDFYVEWTDDYFVTHQYTVAGTVNYFDGFTGGINPTFTPPDSGNATPFSDDRITTAGIASIDIPAIMYALFGISLDAQQAEAFRQHIYKKFGARPDFKEMDGMVGKTAEIFSAMYYFMRQWTYQYNANVPLTFMPELWPGMLLQIPEYNFQCYVTAVTHSGQMGEGGGHQTMVNVAAPARMPDGTNTHHLIGLPIASGVLESNGNVVSKVPAISAQAQKNARLLEGS